MTKKVEMYFRGYCPYCHRAKALLESKNIEFTVYSLDSDPDLRQQMIERANGGYTVPQIFIDDQHVGGCDDLYALERANKLNPLLGLE